MWNVASGLNVTDNLCFTPRQMIDLTYMASLIVRQTQKGARTMVEIVEPFGEFAATNRDAVSPLIYLDQTRSFGDVLDDAATRVHHYYDVLERSSVAVGCQVGASICGEGAG